MKCEHPHSSATGLLEWGRKNKIKIKKEGEILYFLSDECPTLQLTYGC